MARRTLTALLWLFAAWTGVGALSAFIEVPSVAGLVVGLALAVLVWWDPAGRLWKPRADRKLVRRRLADLQRIPAPPPAAHVRPEAETVRG